MYYRKIIKFKIALYIILYSVKLPYINYSWHSDLNEMKLFIQLNWDQNNKRRCSGDWRQFLSEINV